MPEIFTVEGFLKQLKEMIRDYDDPAGPTILTGIYHPPREYVKGGLMHNDRSEWGALREMEVLDLDDLPQNLRGRQVHSVQRVGSTPAREGRLRSRAGGRLGGDAIRIIFKDCAEMGVATEMDVGTYPLSYLPGPEDMEVGRTRVAAIFNFKNQRGGDDSRIAGRLDRLSRPNWAEIKVHHHVLKAEDGGLGSESGTCEPTRRGTTQFGGHASGRRRWLTRSWAGGGPRRSREGWGSWGSMRTGSAKDGAHSSTCSSRSACPPGRGELEITDIVTGGY